MQRCWSRHYEITNTKIFIEISDRNNTKRLSLFFAFPLPVPHTSAVFLFFVGWEWVVVGVQYLSVAGGRPSRWITDACAKPLHLDRKPVVVHHISGSNRGHGRLQWSSRRRYRRRISLGRRVLLFHDRNVKFVVL